ncbi:hypothetical protein FRC12_019239 [Ceratobasidium sp. 428]|nr:hypothetical protein FRC12_019239 [Ceratobasidium sp. 428]
MSTSTLESTLESTLKSTPKSTPQSTPESTPVSTPEVSSVNLNETDSRDDMSLDSIHYDTDGANDAQEDPRYSPTPTPEGGSSGTESEQDRNAKTAQWVAKLRNKIADLHKDIDDLYDEIADLQQDLQEQEGHANKWRVDFTRHLPLAISLTKLALMMVDSELEVDRLIDIEMYSETSCSEHSDPDLVMRRLSECTGGLSECAGDEESENDEHEENKKHGDDDQDEDDDDDDDDDGDDGDDEEEEEDEDEDKDKYEGDDEGEDESEDEHEHEHEHEHEGEHEGEHGEQEQGDKAENKDEEKNHGVEQEGNKNKQSPESLDCDVVMRRPSEFQSDHDDEESDEEEQEEGEVKEEVQAKDKGKEKEKHRDQEEEKEEGELDEDEEKDDNGEKGKGEEREKGEENGQSPETFDFDIIMRRWSEFAPETSQSLNELQDLTVFDYAEDASSSDCSMFSASPTRTTFTFATSYMRSRSPRSRDQTPVHHLSPSLRYRPYERNPPPGDWTGDRCGYITYMFLPTPVLHLARAGGIWSYSRTPPLSSCKNRQVGDIHFTSGEVEGRLYWVCCDMETDSGRGWVPWVLGEAHPLCSNLLLNHFPINEPPHWF